MNNTKTSSRFLKDDLWLLFQGLWPRESLCGIACSMDQIIFSVASRVDIEDHVNDLRELCQCIQRAWLPAPHARLRNPTPIAHETNTLSPPHVCGSHGQLHSLSGITQKRMHLSVHWGGVSLALLSQGGLLCGLAGLRITVRAP